nr:unnamed protein product [Callosobruchus analis]
MSQIKICHVNVRSLLNRFNEFKQQVFNKYDIIAVTETWLTDNIADSAISIVGYKIFRYDRLSRGGGVAVYVKTNIKAVLIKIDINTIEQLWVRICAKNEMIAFGILYRPPSFPVNNFIHILEETIAHLYPTYPGIIIAEGGSDSGTLLTSSEHVTVGLADFLLHFPRSNGSACLVMVTSELSSILLVVLVKSDSKNIDFDLLLTVVETISGDGGTAGIPLG